MTVRTTVAVVPRESFSRSVESLERLLACTPEPRRVVVVDGGSPRRVADRLAELARAHRLRLVRTEYLLSPNQARNLALAHVDTEYVAFVDNDLFVEPGWLAGLEAAADRSGAEVVGPVYLFGDPRRGSIHMAGGVNRFVERPGGRGHEERHRFMGERLTDVRDQLQAGPTELVEFHCMLARTDALRRLGPLDEGLLSLHEHVDLCLAVREAGGTVWFEPSVVVSYWPPARLGAADRRYWFLRWSDDWNHRSIERFAQRWGLDPADPGFETLRGFGFRQRRMAFRTSRKLASRPGDGPVVRVGRLAGRATMKLDERWMAARSARRCERLRRRHPDPVVVVDGW